MDNLTHSLIGITLARTLSGSQNSAEKPKAALDPRAVLWTSVLGNNLPDFDFIVPPLLGGGKLGYLLHHRGHTHTVLFLPLLGLIAAAVGKWRSKTKFPA